MELEMIVSMVALIVSLVSVCFSIGNELGRAKYSQVLEVGAWFEDGCRVSPPPPSEEVVYRAVKLSNGNKVPMNEVVLICVGLYGAGPNGRGDDLPGNYKYRVCIPQLPPGNWTVWMPTSGSGMGVVLAIEIALVDCGNRSWVRRGTGELLPLKKRPMKHHSIPQPCE